MKRIISFFLALVTILSIMTIDVSAASNTVEIISHEDCEAIAFTSKDKITIHYSNVRSASHYYARVKVLKGEPAGGDNERALNGYDFEYDGVTNKINIFGYDLEGAGNRWMKVYVEARDGAGRHISHDVIYLYLLEDVTYPVSLDEAENMLILSDEVEDVRAGKIRYVAQVKSDKYYSKDFYTWGKGVIDSSNKCTRASASMALSFLGIDLTPGKMSDLMKKADIPSPIASVPDMVDEVEKVKSTKFKTLFENYNDNPDEYTPVVAYFNYKSSQHAVVIYAFDGTYYYAADPAANKTHIIRLKFNDSFTKITESPDYSRYTNSSSIRSFTQWKLAD